MKILACEQRTPEWDAARKKCLTTASDMGLWLTKNDQRSKDSRMSRICKHLAGKMPKDAWQIEQEEQEAKRMAYNLPVQRGNALEPEARVFYEKLTGYKVTEVGMCLSDDELFGNSPDGLVYFDNGDGGAPNWPDRGLEIKCPWPETHVEYLLNGTLPDEYRCQVHGSMAITGLNRWDFMSYCPGFPPLLLSAERDQFTAELERGLALFRAEYEARRSQLADLWDASRKEAA